MRLLTDDEFIEGMIGGVGWIIAIYYIRYSHIYERGGNIPLVGLVSWSILWYIRKIGMHIYKDIKRIMSIKNKNINLNYFGKFTLMHHSYMSIFFILLVFYLIIKFPKSTKRLLSFSATDVPLVIYLIIMGTLMYLN